MQFSNAIQQSIYQNVIQPSLKKIHVGAKGIITSVKGGHVDIEWVDPKSGMEYHVEDIPIPSGQSGVHGGRPQIGDRVRLSFINNDPQQPYITIIDHGSSENLSDTSFDQELREAEEERNKDNDLPYSMISL